MPGTAAKAGLRLIWLSLSSLIIGLGLSLGLLIVAPMIIVPIFGAPFAGAYLIVRLLAVVPPPLVTAERLHIKPVHVHLRR